MKRFLVIAVCLLLVAAACGRSDSEQGGGDTSSTSGRSSAPGTQSATFGTLTDVCQKGTPSGSPTQGVSPTEIRVATFSDTGFTGRPGLNQEFFDTAKVFSRWCNDRGGINGRKIVVDERDAALTNVQARMVESCGEDFVTVAGGATFDQDGVETRLKCLLPDFTGFVASPKARGADLVVPPLPNPATALGIGMLRYLGRKFPAATDHVGVLTGDISTTKIVADQNASAARSLGWKIVYNDVYPPAGLTDWTPYAQKLKESGTKGLIWVGEPEGLAGLLGALRDIGYRLDFIRADGEPLRPIADRHRRLRAERGQRLHSEHVLPVRAGRARQRNRPVPRSLPPVPPRRARTAPTSACRRGRLGCCSQRQPRAAATTSPARASTTPGARSIPGSAAVSMHPPIPARMRQSTASRSCARRRRASSG